SNRLIPSPSNGFRISIQAALGARASTLRCYNGRAGLDILSRREVDEGDRSNTPPAGRPGARDGTDQADRRRRRSSRAVPARARQRSARPTSESVGISTIGTPVTVTEVGSPGVWVPGSSVARVASLVPLPSES